MYTAACILTVLCKLHIPTTVQVDTRITFTVKLGNSSDAKGTLHDSTITDNLDSRHFKIDTDTVYLDGKKLNVGVKDNFTYAGGKLGIYVGDLEPGKEITLTFACYISEDAVGKTLYNSAILEGKEGNGASHKTTVFLPIPVEVSAAPPGIKTYEHNILFQGCANTNYMCKSVV